MTNQVAVEAEKLESRRERFRRLAWPLQLGELAESLALARAAVQHARRTETLKRMLNDNLNCIDWASAEIAVETQAELAALRAQLVVWLGDLQIIQTDPHRQVAAMTLLAEWAQKLLTRSGLAEHDDWQTEFDYPSGIRAATEVLV